MTTSDSSIRFLVKGYECFVDDIDGDLALSFWTLVTSPKTNNLYLKRGYNQTIHRIIMARVLERELLTHERVDHKNRNGLDNTRSNLRVATPTQNQANRKVQKNNKLGLKGVHAERNKFRAAIRVNGIYHNLGAFDTPEEAHAAYCEAAREYHGEFANSGEITPSYIQSLQIAPYVETPRPPRAPRAKLASYPRKGLKLTELDKQHIRQWRAMGFSLTAVAHAYDISIEYVSIIAPTRKNTSDEDAQDMRDWFAAGYSRGDIARAYKLSRAATNRIISGESHAPTAPASPRAQEGGQS